MSNDHDMGCCTLHKLGQRRNRALMRLLNNSLINAPYKKCINANFLFLGFLLYI